MSVWVLALAVAPVGVAPADAFPVESLPPARRAAAEVMLLQVLDNEGLFTVAGGLKPVSEGFWQTRVPVGDSLQLIDDARAVLAGLRCGDAIYADVLVYRATYDGKRYASAYVVNRPALADAIRRDAKFWADRGVTPRSHPAEVMMAAEYSDEPARFRGLGYLFGYPRHAVDFFVAASEKQKETGKLVPRDFVNIPTHASEKGRFVYAIPKDQAEGPAEEALREKAGRILSAYRSRRAEYVGPGKPGPAALLRDWYTGATGRCHPANATAVPLAPPPRKAAAPAAHMIP